MGMYLFRPLGLFLLIVAILPWGAWTGARVAPLVAAVAAAESGADGATLTAEAPRAQPDRAARWCRSGVLPGSCEVTALPPGFGRESGPARAQALRPDAVIAGEGIVRAPPRDPPRVLRA